MANRGSLAADERRRFGSGTRGMAAQVCQPELRFAETGFRRGREAQIPFRRSVHYRTQLLPAQEARRQE